MPIEKLILLISLEATWIVLWVMLASKIIERLNKKEKLNEEIISKS